MHDLIAVIVSTVVVCSCYAVMINSKRPQFRVYQAYPLLQFPKIRLGVGEISSLEVPFTDNKRINGSFILADIECDRTNPDGSREWEIRARFISASQLEVVDHAYLINS